jgi:hypothetical protein
MGLTSQIRPTDQIDTGAFFNGEIGACTGNGNLGRANNWSGFGDTWPRCELPDDGPREGLWDVRNTAYDGEENENEYKPWVRVSQTYPATVPIPATRKVTG